MPTLTRRNKIENVEQYDRVFMGEDLGPMAIAELQAPTADRPAFVLRLASADGRTTVTMIDP